MLRRFQRLGIQIRIMLYVTVGLVITFGVFAFVGLRSVREATQLVYEERLSTAYTTAGILERDFLHVARDVNEVSGEFLTGDAKRLETGASGLLNHLSETDPFPFFRVAGVWIVDVDGTIRAEAGEPMIDSSEQMAQIASASAAMDLNQFAALPAVGPVTDGVPFATIVVRLANRVNSPTLVVAVHTVSVNSPAAYIPSAYWRTTADVATRPAQQDKPQAAYHMEVVDASGRSVLGVGEDERPGETSRHYPLIQDLVAKRSAATVLHRPSPGDTFEPHVMAVVPLGSSPFYVILEQPTDVALALPTQLRQRVVLVATLGFAAALLVAWVTTRHVVQPTERLTAEAVRMAKGELSSAIQVRAQDEIGVLAENMEIMRRQLKGALQEVEIANRELDARVKERTAELEQRNEDLRLLFEAIQRKEAQLRILLEKVLRAQEDERSRVSRELHDGIGQALSALAIGIERLERLAGVGGEPLLQEEVEVLKELATSTFGDLHRMTIALRPAALDDLGLLPAIRRYAEFCLGKTDVDFQVLQDGEEIRLSPALETVVYRVVQEAINNVARHSGANRMEVVLRHGAGTLTATVEDDGRGFDPASAASMQGVGLQGMQERASLAGGTLTVDSRPGGGTTVRLEIPTAQ